MSKIEITLTLKSISELDGIEAALEQYCELEAARSNEDDWTPYDQRRYAGALAVLASIANPRKAAP